ncbi:MULTISPECIES: hypothetical protein [unclassified Paenibacillus]|uniref:hypothetical protein n=1 Tax=unclassified Paenibacillus TaxID=185978 RepID=UPI002406195B|nr:MULTISPECIES: hypothetical protein [unclassified Paenibacillus]MDF9841938.1 type 1 fimbria pilin [Paenibacillus sp. PastF-2]MDF9848381.1 type 1 fimbria pilin [Paenibacillus sp. PastM-2]MDF9855098.1 type 1 fimbria pilin [Paenibacillus sp. PastF-1]MDH6480367.1 type 1 fimbria pilin [Paenibacillus sp. PastH-2]MDH6507649.1 type 1 fimbria pilin [Paenibacillus sp. PastM-3]
MRKMIFALWAALVLMLPVSSAFAAEVDESEVVVTGAGLQMTQTKPAFSDITLDLKQSQTSAADSSLYVMDARGTAAGWGIVLRASDFKLTKIVAGQVVEFVIPASSVSFTAQYKSALVGTPIDFQAAKGELASHQVLSSEDSRIVGVIPSEGAGTHQFEVSYILNVPKLITGSNGQQVGLLQGTYTSTFTYTATAGL